MHVRWMTAACAAALLLLVPATAHGQDYPLEIGDLVVDGDSGGILLVESGEQVRITGAGFARGSVVRVTIESDPILLTTTTADGGGAIDVTVAIPAGLPAGSHTLKASGQAPDGSALVLSQPVAVDTAAAAPRSGPASSGGGGASLPRTGLQVAGMAIGGGGLITAGTVLVAAARRRRSR